MSCPGLAPRSLTCAPDSGQFRPPRDGPRCRPFMMPEAHHAAEAVLTLIAAPGPPEVIASAPSCPSSCPTALAGSPQGEDGAAVSHRVAGGGPGAADAVQVAGGRAVLGGQGGPVRDPGDRSAGSGQVAGQRGGAGDVVEHAACPGRPGLLPADSAIG